MQYEHDMFVDKVDTNRAYTQGGENGKIHASDLQFFLKELSHKLLKWKKAKKKKLRNNSEYYIINYIHIYMLMKTET